MTIVSKLESGIKKFLLTASFAVLPLGANALNSHVNTSNTNNNMNSSKTEQTSMTEYIQTPQEDEKNVKSFVGRPIDINKNTKDLDFIMESYDQDQNRKYSFPSVYFSFTLSFIFQSSG